MSARTTGGRAGPCRTRSNAPGLWSSRPTAAAGRRPSMLLGVTVRSPKYGVDERKPGRLAERLHRPDRSRGGPPRRAGRPEARRSASRSPCRAAAGRRCRPAGSGSAAGRAVLAGRTRRRRCEVEAVREPLDARGLPDGQAARRRVVVGEVGLRVDGPARLSQGASAGRRRSACGPGARRFPPVPTSCPSRYRASSSSGKS